MKIPTQFPVEIIGKAGNAKIRTKVREKNGVEYTTYIVDYILNGKRCQPERADFAEAHGLAVEAVAKMANEDAQSTTLTNGDRFAYLRAIESAAAAGKPLDVACREYAEAVAILGGKGSLVEAVRFWSATHAVTLAEITVADACTEMNLAAKADGKSAARCKQIAGVLKRLCQDFSGNISAITPDQISKYLSGLKLSERSKRNHRDVLGFFNRWLCLRKYLPKGADWFENVQNYSARKQGEITIYTPAEIKSLLGSANGMTAFLAIGAFAGLRHAEIARLDWSEVDLADGYIEVVAAKSKTGERRLVPITANLKTWLTPISKKAGPVVPYLNTTKQLLKIAREVNVPWKKNALRHSFISYRVAESADVARVADEAGNSPTVIRQNYLRRVKPAQATEWFGINRDPNAKSKLSPEVRAEIEADKI